MTAFTAGTISSGPQAGRMKADCGSLVISDGSGLDISGLLEVGQREVDYLTVLLANGQEDGAREHAALFHQVYSTVLDVVERQHEPLRPGSPSREPGSPGDCAGIDGNLVRFCYEIATTTPRSRPWPRPRTPAAGSSAANRLGHMRRSPRQRKSPPKRFIDELEDARKQRRPRRSLVESRLTEEKYEFESVVDHRGGYGGVLFEVRIRWVGHGVGGDSWECARNVEVYNLAPVREYIKHNCYGLDHRVDPQRHERSKLGRTLKRTTSL